MPEQRGHCLSVRGQLVDALQPADLVSDLAWRCGVCPGQIVHDRLRADVKVCLMVGEEACYGRLDVRATENGHLAGANNLAEHCGGEADPDVGCEKLRVTLLLLLR